jgi:hypothetical protein
MLELSLAVSRDLPVPMTACMASALDLSTCSVIVSGHNSTRDSFGAGLSLTFKAAVDPTCTLARVYVGLCSACTAAAATAGTCPPGEHTFILDMGLPGGVQNGTMLGMVFHVGSSLLSAEVNIQFEVISDWKGPIVTASKSSETLQTMLVSSKVCLFDTMAFHAIRCPCGTAVSSTISSALQLKCSNLACIARQHDASCPQ